MREEGLRAKGARKFKITTDSWRSKRIAFNILQRRFNPSGPNCVWCGDITYLITDEGWEYLAVFIDLYSRKVVGWATSRYLTREVVLRAFRQAVLTRNPVPGLIVHTDRGSQYSSDDFIALAESSKLTLSMSRKGNCWDNAVVESFFATLKRELTRGERFSTRSMLESAVSQYIDVYYNTERMHSTLDYVSPLEYETRNSVRLGEDAGGSELSKNKARTGGDQRPP
jgi:hypothetical protein